MIIQPFGFLQGPVAGAAPRTDIPPITSGLEAYFDATNSTYSSATSWQDVLSLGTQYTFNQSDTTDPTYDAVTNNGIYTFNGSTQSWQMDSTYINSTLNNIAGSSHTIMVLVYLDAQSEEDIWSNGAPPSNANNAVLLMGFSGRVRTHCWSGNGSGGTNVWSTDRVLDIRFNWNVVVQRFSISGGNATIDGLIWNGTTLSKSATQTKTWGTPSASPTLDTYVGYRGFGSGRMDGAVSQAAIYTTALSDSDIQTVGDYMLAKI